MTAHDSSKSQSRLQEELERGETDSRRMEQALRLSEETFRNLMDYIPGVSVQGYRPDGIVFYWNKASEAVYGYTAEEAIGKNLGDLIVPADLRPLFEHCLQIGKQVRRSGEFMPSGELVLLHKDGHRVPVYSIHAAVYAAGKEPLLFCIDVDLSERKRAEEALRESEAQYRSTINSMPLAIHVVDAEMRVVLFNNAFQEWNKTLGLSGDATGKNLFEAFPFLPERTREEYRRVFRTGQALITEEGTRIGGREIQTETRKVPVFEKGEVVRIVTVIEDVTQRKRSEEAMLRASRMEATATLAGGIAHDFNNLMVAVLGNAELLRLRCGERPEAEMLDDICRAAQQAGELAQQMLAFARGGKYQPKVMNLNDTIQETLRLQERSFPPRVRIERDIAPELWNVEADPAQMGQVLMNLCINAVEAIPGNGRILLTTRNIELKSPLEGGAPDLPPGRYVYLAVEDTGCGMSAKTLERVFEPFFSTKFQGRGLGLAAVYGIIKNHGGRITVYSEPGQGATFKIYLPATPAEIPAWPKPESGIPTGTETLLVIDDEAIVLDATRKMLERLGYQVLCARNGEEALELARSFEGDIHLALLDMGMPVMGGAEAWPRLKEIRPGLKVIVCSGYELDASSQALLDAGASAFLQKPFRVTELAQALRRALEEQ